MDAAHQLVLQTVYDHFQQHSKWPLVRQLELQLEDELDSVGGLQFVCVQIGADKIVCGSPYSETDTCELRLRGFQVCRGTERDTHNFLTAVRHCGQRCRQQEGHEVTVSASEWVEGLGFSNDEAKRVSLMFAESHIWRSASYPPEGWASFTLNHFSSKVAEVHTLQEFLDKWEAQCEREREAAFARGGWDSPKGTRSRRVFLSHAAADKGLAELVQRALKPLDVFLASQPGKIRPGVEWLQAIQRELREADTYLVLLTPNSVERPWVWFETGAAWMKEGELIPCVAAGLAVGEVPYPLQAYQLLSLENAQEAAAIFEMLDVEIDSVTFCEQMRQAGVGAFKAGIAEGGWHSVALGRRIFAWDGPHHGLEDREHTTEPAGLDKALIDAGLKPYHASRRKLANHLKSGWFQVFETDCKSWRRQVVAHEDAVLIVRSSKAD